MRHYFPHGLFLLLALGLCACVPDNEPHEVCRTLKSQLVFNGATSNVRESEIQTAQKPLQQVSFDKHCMPR